MTKSSALMSYNIFTFPSEAQMLLHIKLWEEHFPAMFERLKEKGCTAYSYNQVWNSPGTYKTSVMYEYESPESFKACQQVNGLPDCWSTAFNLLHPASHFSDAMAFSDACDI